MTVGRDSRFQVAGPCVVLIDSAGAAAENMRVDLPYPRPDIAVATRPDITQYTVRGDDTWRNLAQRFFHGRADLSWAIMEFSGVIDPFTELRPGKTTPNAGGTLTIPSFDTVMFDLVNQ